MEKLLLSARFIDRNTGETISRYFPAENLRTVLNEMLRDVRSKGKKLYKCYSYYYTGPGGMLIVRRW